MILENGQQHEGDLLVGADGIWSKVLLYITLHFLIECNLFSIDCFINEYVICFMMCQVRKGLFGHSEAVYSGYTCYTGIADFIPADIETVG